MRYIAGAFPSACGKTNLAMLIPTLPGWKAETIGDDICWMKFDDDGRLRAINPEAGFFGVAPGTGMDTNPNAIAHAHRQLHLHEHGAHRRRRRVVGGDHQDEAGPRHRLAGPTRGRPSRATPAAHPNARFTAPAGAVPVIAPEWEDPAGVPISAILFGGRRATVGPARDRGLQLGARRVPRLDHGLGDHRGGRRRGRQPAPRPLRHAAVLRLQHGRLLGPLAEHRGRAQTPSLPKIFYVNWFRKDADGRFLWPGFGENSRVLEWIFDRVDGSAGRGRHADRPPARLTARSTCPVSTCRPTDVAELLQGRRRGLAQGAAGRRRLLRRVRRPRARGAARRARRPGAPPHRSLTEGRRRAWPTAGCAGRPTGSAPAPTPRRSRTARSGGRWRPTDWPAPPRACGRWPSPSPCSSRRATPAWTAVAACSRLLPYVLLSPLAGALADRWGHRRTLEVTSVVRIGLAALVTARHRHRRPAGGAGARGVRRHDRGHARVPDAQRVRADRRGVRRPGGRQQPAVHDRRP